MLQKPELSAGAMGQLGYLGKLALQEHFVRWGWSIEGSKYYFWQPVWMIGVLKIKFLGLNIGVKLRLNIANGQLPLWERGSW